MTYWAYYPETLSVFESIMMLIGCAIGVGILIYFIYVICADFVIKKRNDLERIKLERWKGKR